MKQIKMLSKNEAKVFAKLLEEGRRVSLTDLTALLGMKKSNLANYVKKLMDYGLIEAAKEGNKKLLFAYPLHISDFLNITKAHPFIKPSDYLAGRNPYLLAYFRGRIGKEFALKDLELPLISAKRIVKMFRKSGLVYMPRKGRYYIKEDARLISSFCQSILRHVYFAQVRKDIKGATAVTFSYGPNNVGVLIFSDKESKAKNYWPTAYTAFAKYGIKLIAMDAYYYTNIKPSLASILLHALSVSMATAGVIDTRRLSYILALIVKKKVDFKKIIAESERREYAIIPKEIIEQMGEFISTKGSKTYEGFPTWEEIEEIAYGKAV